ncbi:hypothetical protein PENSPDRAFT_653264 [Peniophora sp. CONT]|nr:hypothetical protein PENSPDRAFT_653264 [Peniophora sp. CONT]
MPFILRPSVTFDGPIDTQPITVNRFWEVLKQAFASVWAFIVKVATAIMTWTTKTLASIITWFKETDLGSKFIEICSIVFSSIDNFTRAHPLWTGIPLVLFFGPNLIRTIVFIPWFTFQLLLLALGFNRRGVSRGSLAASYESQHYTYGTGGIPRSSSFAYMQSAGARAPIWRTSFVMFIWYAVDMALAVWGFYILGRYYGIVQ